MPRISAFDPGSQRMGWCAGSGDAIPRAGAFRFEQAGRNLGRMAHDVQLALEEHFRAFGPDEVVYEEPLLLRHDSIDRLRKTYTLGAMIELVCLRHNIPCSEVSPRAVKEALVGRYKEGMASKADMVHVARKIGVVLPTTKADGLEDAADAVGIWLCLLRVRDPRAGARFDKVIYGRAGAMF